MNTVSVVVPLPVTGGAWHASTHGRGATIKTVTGALRRTEVAVASVYDTRDVPAFLALPELYRIVQALATANVADDAALHALQGRARALVAHTEQARAALDPSRSAPAQPLLRGAR